MLIFEYILILLAAICLSNVVNRFIPVASVPIIQIALGALITLLPLKFQFELDPDLFFVLFVAPIIFYVSMMSDKKTMWAQRKPILNMGVVLVIVTVVMMGYLVNFLIPTIPLAAAFALIAALGPTDDVAVASVSKRVNVPHKIMSILQGESIVNDASGIVSFQFALAAILTGSFSLFHATGRFFVVALGGIAVGLMFSWLKYILVRWIRSLGMENVTLHLLLGILTPFLLYLIAERLGVSGILAIFAAGIAHSFNRNKFNPEAINLNIASQSVWSMLTFTLEGLVFVILGTQLPQILVSINQNYSIGTWEIVAYILLLTFLFLILRFVWSIVAVKKKTYDDPEHHVSRLRAGLIFSLSGARGTVTLASVMSIPILLSDGSAFPERDLIILIAGGVIVVSLVITSFILPLCVEKKVGVNKSEEHEAHSEILQKVIAELKRRITPENEAATTFVITNYHGRNAELQRKQNHGHVDREEERRLRLTTCAWEKGNTLSMLKREEITEHAAQHYVSVLDTLTNKISGNNPHPFSFRRSAMHFFQHHFKPGGMKQHVEANAGMFKLMETNTLFVLEKLRQMSQKDVNIAIKKTMFEFESRLLMLQRRNRMRNSHVDNEMLASVVSCGFQVERDHIQAMLELGRISRETAKEMRCNISLLEIQLKKEYF